MKQIRAQVNRLKEIFPDKAICISLNMWDFSSMEKENEWSVYIEGKYSNTRVETFKEVVDFVDYTIKKEKNTPNQKDIINIIKDTK